MEQDPSLQRLVVTLNASLKLETSALQATYEKWRAGQVELHEHKKLLDEELEALREAKQQLAADRATFERRVAREWGPAKLDPRRRVVVRVGGQSFQTTVAVLTRDRFSLLAAMAAAACAADDGADGRPDADGSDEESRSGATAAAAAAAGAAGESEPPAAGSDGVAADAEDEGDGLSPKAGSAKPQRRQRVADTLRRGAYGSASADGAESGSRPAGRIGSAAPSAELFLDRDWWLFRHILAFLRSGPEALPSDSELLRQLYVESAYLRLQSLRTAIERRLVDRRLPQALLDPEFAAAPLTRDAGAALGGLAPTGRHGGFGGVPGGPLGAGAASQGGRAAAKAGEALAWARWARGGAGDAAAFGAAGAGGASRQSWGVAPADVPGPLSGAMGGVRNAAALFAGAELDAELKGNDGAVDVDGMGVDLEALVGAMERTRRRAGMAAGPGQGEGEDEDQGAGAGGRGYGAAGRGRGGAGFEPLLEAAAAAAEGAGGPGVGSAGWWSWRDDLAGLASGDDEVADLDLAGGY
ncbi:hypothetical protein FNF29_08248 [Cafeteria roenbergensis]|uniref:BTB domain-containing protein n=2 Tax=Cafeteria roenbergensis TaxID=33653 RepID=A0A5A8DFZ3_CAFRO|nr:hypothetical protein FNF29_08248 [Cafeteria roenbergensis]KAA0164443.1 hypothetical protein FNF31_02367 [Cafeteria roenbergensis]|eukprot:KAA0146106.1 hypothetical protein FNF29_08248 [Cafeteria roenbergensis]